MTSRRELKKLCEAGHVRKIWDTDLGILFAVQALALISSMISSALFPGEETI